MTIVKAEDTKVAEFGTLTPGEVFEIRYEFDNETVIAMKTDNIYDEEGVSFQAVNLANGDLFHMDNDEKIIPLLNAQLVI